MGSKKKEVCIMSLCHAHTPIKETLLSFGSYVIWILKEPTSILLATSQLLFFWLLDFVGSETICGFLDFVFFWLDMAIRVRIF